MTGTSRRDFLANGFALGCSIAASPLLTPVTLASTPGARRLVVIILRGAMDGLDVVRPSFDPEFAKLRPNAVAGRPLTQGYTLHPALAPLMPMWSAGDLSFAHAVSTPYRNKRSHFDGQDLLETGGVDLSQQDGWLNRMLGTLPATRSEQAFAIGRERLLLLSGSQKVSSWSPDSNLQLSPQARLLIENLYQQDPLFHQAAAQAIALSDLDDGNPIGARRAGRAKSLAAFAAGRLLQDTRIAAFSINGWDTHARQEQMLPKALSELTDALLTLQTQLGNVWSQTTVLCLTEFGRTVRLNGSGGTDHGTGGVAVLAGGAVRGGRVFGTWPGLDTLYEDRDLLPTEDVRRYAAWALHSLYPVSRTSLETVVFPGLDMGSDPAVLT